MAELLFEIGTEEIPAGFLTQALIDLPRLAAKKLAAARLPHDEPRALGTPRRLTLVVRGLAARQEDLAEDLIGPPARVAFKDGQPTKAAESFAKKAGVEVAAIRIVSTDKGDYCGARREVAGQPAAGLLPDILLAIVRELPFKKSMRWAARDEAFVRPIRWLLALFDGQVVPIEFAGTVSGGTTQGHRFHHPAPVAVSGVDDYVAKLRERQVVVDPAERHALVVAEIRRLEAETGVKTVDDPGLVDEVANLVEHPTGLCGSFDEKFLEVPREVIVAAMRGHQRYFAMVDAAGKLANRFVTMAGTATRDPGLVRRGNERVLAARLSDARFFYAEDQKVTLAERGERLKGMVFINKLGTQAERVERVRALALGLAQLVGAEVDQVARAAELCKADLTTQMVGEFPELQGVMGRDYALKQGEDPAVADAILEHYLPRGASDQLPQGLVGAVLGVADRADAIVGCFGVGLQPTGSADPYALRRAALGILQVVLARGWRLSLKDLAHNAARGYGQPKFVETLPAVLEFLRGRLRGVLADPAPNDVVDAVLAAGFEDVVDAAARTRALAALRQRADFEPIAVAFKRIANILRSAEPAKGSAPPATSEDGQSQPPLTRSGETVADGGEMAGPKIEPEEQALADAFAALEKRVAALIADHAYDTALQDLTTLRGPVDAFFDKVLVMDPDPAIKARRLGLLGRINRLFMSIADFRQLSV